MQLLTLEPMVLCLCLYSAILLGILYLFFGAFNLVFVQVYGFELWQVGMSFLGITVGMLVAVGQDPLWRRNYARLERNHIASVGEKGDSMPEWRLPPAIAGAPPVTIGIFIFAWTAYPHVHWIAPIIGTSIFGMGYVFFSERKKENTGPKLIVGLYQGDSRLFWRLHFPCGCLP